MYLNVDGFSCDRILQNWTFSLNMVMPTDSKSAKLLERGVMVWFVQLLTLSLMKKWQ